MSDLLNSASLVMIPSGYAEDKVYSAVPTDGSGDLSFTRASNGTRVNSAGLVEVCPWNLLDNSNGFTSASWVLTQITSTSGQSDPLGGNLGWRFNETTANDQHRFYYGFLTFNTGVVTQSIYVKSLGRDQIFIGSNSNSENLIFTFSTETISSVTGFTNTSATSVGNGWYRISGTFIGFSPINCLFVQGYNGGLSYAGDTAKGFYAFGGQVNYGSTAKPYFPTTDRLNVPRLTYQNGGGGCPSLLLEKQSTNLTLYSEQFDNAYWTKQKLTVTANSIVSPDGTQNAYLLTADTTNGEHNIYAPVAGLTITANAPFTVSCYVKKGTGRYFAVTAYFAGNGFGPYATFDLNTATLVASGAPLGTCSSSKIENMGNDWYRCSVTGFGAYTSLICAADIRTASSLIPGGAFVGSGQTFHIWGFQVEQSSYPTSLINTTSASATRVADECSKTGISSLIGQTEGVVFCDFNYIATTNTSDTTPIRLLGSGSAGIYLEINANNTFESVVINSAGTLVLNSTSSAQTAGRYKFAIAYKANDYAYYLNGTQIGVSTSGAFSSASLNSLYLGMYQSGSQHLGGSINESILFPTRLTNAELASLTTI
jgi:hypothetical protein